MGTNDMAGKRSMLFSARIRFSPETQPIRETAIDKIIEQNLLIADCDEGLTLHEIEEQGTVSFACGIPALSRRDMQESLRRLAQTNRVIVLGKQKQQRFKLSAQALQDLHEIQRATETRFSHTIERLFKNSGEGFRAYATPFLECLCLIFSRLGETYVRLIKREINSDDLLNQSIVPSALQEVKRKYQALNPDLLQSAVISFFQDIDPEYDAIKWNMAQNYYVSMALGLDPSGYLLSKEVFGDAVFYLDTNVIIDALEPRTEHHRSFEVLGAACRQLQVQLDVAQISLDELRNVVESQLEFLPKVANQIPDDLALKVRGVFFELWREQLTSKGAVDFDSLFSNFLHPMKILEQSYGVALIDDPWFAEAENHQETQRLAEAIRMNKGKRRYAKGKRSALHDAVLIRWIQLERERGARNTWLVTLDNSLPVVLIDPEDASNRPSAITLDALLQWISPMAIHSSNEEEVATIFSEAVRYQLLPQEVFFDLRDFLVFAEMEWSTKQLPAEDVEACIRYVKSCGPNLDPTDPSDREKIAHEISKFFADPGRKYKREIQRLEAEISRVDGEHREEEKRLTDEHQRERQALEERIARLEQERVEREAKSRTEALKRSAWSRLILVVVLISLIEAIMFYLTWQYGEGANLLQKISRTWPLLAGVPAVGIVLSWFYIGKERIQALGWALSKTLKGE